ncbi:VIT1/CCC1 transporter family protein [Sphingobium vermicomposti]|uniref:VIT1/CCC1 family predicted Fe2+/Mn2+ transporter n=1 Tax=Sphingobium vermicomposti TaxID=529005 RepID=A0A846M6R1_9SPHN|nr:VIT family protein [Sphingobium vermicomposti]NIJ16858.1 VIT1/CCC1 family predicted Fe2+/Mn2+ transporter [Sphingobium vermicomposti]
MAGINAETAAHAPPRPHHAVHYVNRVGWLRAAILGANDGIVSTASLLTGVAASGASRETILLTGIAALLAGAMSMAAGEYVSVSAQSDTERADLAKEKAALIHQPDEEWRELRDIYVERGLSSDLAGQVARELMNADALGAHARDELGISDISTARPVQAALTSAATFAAGAITPVIGTALSPQPLAPAIVVLTSLLCLALLGYIGARLGGGRQLRSVMRVLFWGALAMGVTAAAGRLFGAAI